MKKLAAPVSCPRKRIFLSYGHDEHVSLAVRLRNDLTKRGHKVWFDEDRLQPGYDWEEFIERGIEDLAADKANSALLLLLTPRSVRRPDGYCLNEVARALSRGLPIIPLMVVTSEPPLSICRIQWLDMRQCIPINKKEKFYRPCFKRLLAALEEDKLDFEGTQQRLLRALQPLAFDADILHHVPKFSGRQWVFKELQRWLAQLATNRVFWICGDAGVGKTALSAVLSSQYLEVAALHLCKFGHAQKSDPCHVVTSLAYQLSTQLPEYEARLAAMDVERLVKDDARTIFDNLLVQPLARLTPPRRAVVILIDALDEATNNGRNELASFLAAEFPKTPEWLRLIITSRPEPEIKLPLQALNPLRIDTKSEANLADVRDYLRRELAAYLEGRTDARRIIEGILKHSEGVFLYVEHFCADLRHGNLSLDRPDQFPQGLGGVYSQFFERQFPDLASYAAQVRPALRAILAAQEPLPTEILQRLFGWKEEELHDFTQSLGSLFPVTNEDEHEVIKPYHHALAEWLTEKQRSAKYFISLTEGHALLADYCWQEFNKSPAHIPPYVTRHLPVHFAEANRWEELLRVTRDGRLRLVERWTERQPQAGLQCLQGLIHHMDETNQDRLLAAGYATQLARIFSRLDQFEEAETCLLRALKWSAGTKGRRTQAIAYHELGSLALYRNERQKSEQLYRRASKLCEAGGPGLRDEAGANLVALAVLSLGQYDYERAAAQARLALRYARASEDYPHVCAANRLLANIAKDHLRFAEAREHLQAAALIAVLRDLPFEKAAISHLSGWLQYQHAALADKFTDGAMESFKKALEEAGRISHAPYTIGALVGEAQCHLLHGRLDKAGHRLQEAGDFLRRTKRHPDLEVCWRLAGASIALLKGKFTVAKSEFREVAAAAHSLDEAAREADAWVGLGAAEFHCKRLKQAEECWHKAASLAHKCSPLRLKLILKGIARNKTGIRLGPL